ncbi:RagB/SusD family nutrient uptake outer membrane protein [Myroides odoratimimus]|uniref:RagB/SusD family nutrient uptake outer membrane protein n=1 Tax=Myroides odoratimimus TaxID=76832 RepID=UPI00257520B6|nr:RagB/SusD family nutrient uptake outer membrane protein [Myroides odoratimimus]MDM1493971.1 RagB/SusD family nutrient uptake outer membrane protein [Myroides odoratimimus]MDM1511438.1 RagB/SusD family nutrient uptake outer membrane protein [Myroides odoratimimus]
MKKIIFSILSVVLLSAGMTSCSDDRLDATLEGARDIESKPLVSATDLRAAVSGAYYRMVNYNYYGRDMVIFSEVRGDNAYAAAGFSNRFQNVSSFTLTPTHAFPSDTWKKIYEVISSANLAIGSNITIGDKTDINQGKAEALAIRALAHFDLLRLFGQQNVDNAGLAGLGVPYITQFGELDAKNYKRLSVREVRDLIYRDLDEALTLVDKNATKKTRFNAQSINGVKSRVALFFGAFDSADYNIAMESAEKALSLGGGVVQRSAYVASFRAEEPQSNSILELAQDNINNQGINGLSYIYSYLGYGDVVGIEENLKALFTDKTDIRSSEEMQGMNMVKDEKGAYKLVSKEYIPLTKEELDGTVEVDPKNRYKEEYYRNFGKYTAVSSNIKVMRYEELIYNYAEAAVRTKSNVTRALELVNKVAEERYEGNPKAKFTSLTLETVLAERRKELVFEGFRFDDQMRNKENLGATPQSKDGIKYGDAKLAFPIPRSEINDSKIDQNKGY